MFFIYLPDLTIQIQIWPEISFRKYPDPDSVRSRLKKYPESDTVYY